MKVFDAYASYYDLLYKDKDYNTEADYIEKFIKQYKPDSKTILDLGCGTGKHDFIFAEKGYEVTGVELSEQMICAANKNLDFKDKMFKNLKFVHGDIKKIKLAAKFDIIVALFHVMSYQTKNEDVKLTLNTVKKHLQPDGVFIFDFWYGPAVLTERPESRLKKLESEDILVERFAEPVLKLNENVVEVNYKLSIKERLNGNVNDIIETHRMRYFFLPEINFYLNDFEMELKHFEEWLTSNELTDNSWSALAIASNKKK